MNSNIAGVRGTDLELDWCMIYWCTFPVGCNGKIVLLFAEMTRLWTVATHKSRVITAIVLVTREMFTSFPLVYTICDQRTRLNPSTKT